MHSQRFFLFTIGGELGNRFWNRICRWSDTRKTARIDEWSSDDWPTGTKVEVDAFVETLAASGYTPPILYRSEHVDCWSTGDVYETALVKRHPDHCRRLFTLSNEIIATWVRCSEQIIPDEDAPAETRWLFTRINEAIDAWGEFAESRLVILVRSVLGGSWTDEEVIDALASIPAWWTETEQAQIPEPAVGPALSDDLPPPAR